MNNLPQDFDYDRLDKNWDFLVSGCKYKVSKDFIDYDGSNHPAGEEWIFIGSNFVPYDDGLSLFVEAKDGNRHQIRLQYRSQAQAAILDDLASFITQK